MITVDLGMEPPLAPSGRTQELPARRKVNLRWLLGTVLTGIAGIALLYAAGTSTIDTSQTIIQLPQMIKPRELAGGGTAGLTVVYRKADRLVQRADIIAARQTYKIPVTRKVGGAEVIRLASFTRIASPMAQDTLGFADAIPAYNAARLIADASEDKALEEAPPSTLDADVALQTRNFDEMNAIAKAVNRLSEAEITAQVNDAVQALRRPVGNIPAQMMLAKAMKAPTDMTTTDGFGNAGRDPFSRLVVRMVQENVSVFPRLEAALARNVVDQRVVNLRADENVENTLRGFGATPAQARDIVRNIVRSGSVTTVGRLMKLSLQSLEPGMAKSLVRVDLYNDDTRVGAVGRKDDGSFVPIETPRSGTPAKKAATDEDGESEGEGGFTLYQSINETARKHNMPKAMIDDMVRVLFFDVDLQRAVSPNDSMEVLIGNDDIDGNPTELLMLGVTIGGETRRFYRFPLPEDEVVDYFDDQGRSAKKFLIRKPIVDGELRSTFGSRRHPILGYWRLHNGVDWAARIGTPILAAGSGTVRFADWNSGYGRRVEIQHSNGYVTTYNHMSAFGRGITEGVRVRQGQVIGYLGSSGLSTGPHLHYEVMIDERFVDPLAIKLPRGREITGNNLAEFKRQREQVEQILKKAPGSVAATASARP